jgi:cytochrome P450
MKAMNSPLHPEPAPPPLAQLQASPLLRAMSMAQTVWRARRNLLHIVHPGVADVPWHVSQMGASRLVTVNDADLARHVLRDAAERYAKGPLYHALLDDVLGRGSILLEGEAARQRRRLLAPAFNARAMARVQAVVDRRVAATVADWAKRAGKGGAEIDVSADAARMAMEIVLEAFFGADLGARMGDAVALLDRLFVDASTPSLADLLSLPPWAPRRSRASVRDAVAEVDALLMPLIDARMGRPSPPDGGDLLDRLIGARDPETGAALDRDTVRDEVMTLFLAGHETTALSVAWGLDRLAREPGWAKRIAADPALVPLAYEEILRLYPPAYILARCCVATDRWGALEIRVGDRVQVPIFMLHRNARYWSAPHAFDPTRFAGSVPAAFMPFGLGARACIGMGLARIEGRALLSAALTRLRLSPVGPPPRPVGRVTLRSESPIRVAMTPR